MTIICYDDDDGDDADDDDGDDDDDDGNDDDDDDDDTLRGVIPFWNDTAFDTDDIDATVDARVLACEVM